MVQFSFLPRIFFAKSYERLSTAVKIATKINYTLNARKDREQLAPELGTRICCVALCVIAEYPIHDIFIP